MSRIFNLNNKLVSVDHKISKQEFVDINMNQTDFENQVKSELIKQLSIYVMKKFPISVTQPKHDNDNFRWTSKGYIFSERELLEIILEISELDKKGLDILNNSTRVELSNMI